MNEIETGFAANLREQVVEPLREILPDGTDLGEWISDPDLTLLDDLDPQPHEDAMFAIGYLRGAADACNLTALEVLDHWGVLP